LGLGAIALITRPRLGDEEIEGVGMFSTVIHQLPSPVRVRAVPDLFDRARLASVALLAGFVALALALVGHMASSELPLHFVGGFGSGQVLTTGDQVTGHGAVAQTPGAAGSTRSDGDSAAGGGAATGAGSPPHQSGNHRSGGTSQTGFTNVHNVAPQPVPVSIGSSGAGQPSGTTNIPSSPPAPTSTPSEPAGNSGQGTGESGPPPKSHGKGNSGKVKSTPPGHLKHSSTSSTGDNATSSSNGNTTTGKRTSSGSNSVSSATTSSAATSSTAGNSGKVKNTPPGHLKNGS
jgi:hypothetical protein